MDEMRIAFEDSDASSTLVSSQVQPETRAAQRSLKR